MYWIITSGGLLMWPIVLAGLLAVAIFFERVLHYHRAQINTTDFLNGIRNLLGRRNHQEAIAMCQDTAGPVAKVVKAAIVNRNRSREELLEAVQDVARIEIVRLERYLPVLATIAQITPLIGFLGTVFGMIKIFKVIQVAQLASPGQMAQGIWEALLTTAGGLVVAIPAYIAYNFLVSRMQALVLDMERAANEMVTFLTRRDEDANVDEPIVLASNEKK